MEENCLIEAYMENGRVMVELREKIYDLEELVDILLLLIKEVDSAR